MKKINNHHPSNFWFGFSLGTIAAISAGYLLGTKKGREFLKKLVEYAEQFPEKIPELINELKKNSPESKEIKPFGLKTIDSIINKIKHTSED